jgi:hypothetical protein
VEHFLARRDQIVSDDAPMAAPPDGLGAHDRTEFLVAQPAQLGEAGLKCRVHGVVGVVVKALVLPERIGCRRHVALVPPQSAEFGDLPIPDLSDVQTLAQGIRVVLRVGA